MTSVAYSSCFGRSTFGNVLSMISRGFLAFGQNPNKVVQVLHSSYHIVSTDRLRKASPTFGQLSEECYRMHQLDTGFTCLGLLSSYRFEQSIALLLDVFKFHSSWIFSQQKSLLFFPPFFVTENEPSVTLSRSHLEQELPKNHLDESWELNSQSSRSKL